MEPQHNELTDTINQFRAGAHETVDYVANATTQAADALSQKSERCKATEQQLVDNCRAYIHENPLVSLGIAVGAGFLLSRLLNMR